MVKKSLLLVGAVCLLLCLFGSSAKAQSNSLIANVCAPLPSSIVAWWKGEGNGLDSIGPSHAAEMKGVLFGPGVVGSAFLFGPDPSYVKISAHPRLDFSRKKGFTVEGWILPLLTAAKNPIITYHNGQNVGVQFRVDPNPLNPARGSLYAEIVDSTGASHQIHAADAVLVGDFQHVALTYDKEMGIAKLYRNGEIVSAELIGEIKPLTSYDLYIGHNPSGSVVGQTFAGEIDELSLYKEPLSDWELLGIYVAGAAGKCPPPLPPGNCITAPTNIVAWWRAENDGNDAVGSNHGTVSNVTYVHGAVGSAFLFGANPAYVKVPASSSLDVGMSGGFTIEAWINPSKYRGPIVEYHNGQRWGVHFYTFDSSGAGALYANIVTSSGTWRQISSAAGTIRTNEYQHVALTYDKATGVAKLYRNGEVIAQASLGSFTPLTSNYDLYIGHRPNGTTGDPQETFPGQIDEMSLYSRALADSEILGIYQAGTNGKCHYNQTSATSFKTSVPSDSMESIRLQKVRSYAAQRRSTVRGKSLMAVSFIRGRQYQLGVNR